MGIPLLNDIFVIFAVSAAVLYIFNRLRIPAIIGYILTGILLGPHSLGLVGAAEEVERLAEIGIVLLLFTIGLEFSFKKILRIRKSFLLGGSLQVVLTCLTGFALAKSMGLPNNAALFMGFLVSLSSTAIVLKILQNKAQVDTPHGSATLAILIFQDVIVVPMMLFTPLLAGGDENFERSLLVLLAKSIAIIVMVIMSAKWVVPWLLFRITRTRSRELFFLAVVVICLAVAWLTSSAGLSLALGAFLAGLIISESEYSHQALGDILPFRDVFTSFFFVSIGMLLDFHFVVANPLRIISIVMLVLLFKAVIAGLATAALGFPVRTMVLVGLALSQVGEFSFVLSRTGIQFGILSQDNYQLFLSVAVLTMAVTPFVMALAPALAGAALRLPLPQKLKADWPAPQKPKAEDKQDLLIVIGMGVNGKNLVRAAKLAGIPYEIIETNPETVRSEKAKGEPIFYGDAAHEAVLAQTNLKQARIVVVAINDPTATRRITGLVRKLNPKVYIIVRTRFLQEMKPLHGLGADEVIPEEFETSVEIFTRVLAKYLVPKNEIAQFVGEIRSGGYQMLRSLAAEPARLSDLKINVPDLEVSAFRLQEKAPAAGKTIAQIELRKKHAVTLVAIRRGSKTLANPGADAELLANDLLFVLGAPDKIAKACKLFTDPEQAACPATPAEK